MGLVFVFLILKYGSSGNFRVLRHIDAKIKKTSKTKSFLKISYTNKKSFFVLSEDFLYLSQI